MNSMLIVDDCADNREFCRLIAEVLKFEVKLAANVDEAFEILYGGFVPRVILLDFMMPGRLPDELVKYVKQKPELAQTKVILTSAVRDVRTVAQDMGADQFLRKPYDINEFVESFRKISPVAG